MYRDVLIITKEFLRANPDHVFVFGDNIRRVGKGGAAILRDEPNVYGFITKINPGGDREDYFDAVDYLPWYVEEMHKLMREVENNPGKKYLITALGAGLANAFGIWEDIIQPTLRPLLQKYPNVIFTWEEE